MGHASYWVHNHRMLIWADEWQFECCGDDFAVGGLVEWQLEPADSDYLAQVLGPELASRVSWAEDHHVGEVTLEVAGHVRSIQRVFCQLALLPERRVHYPVPGSGVLDDVPSSAGNGSVKSDRERHFEHRGYLVEIDVEHQRSLTA
jgi:hypothetical protein